MECRRSAWSLLPPPSPWNILFCEDFATTEESIPCQSDFDLILGHNTTSPSVSILFQTRAVCLTVLPLWKAIHRSAWKDTSEVDLYPPSSLYGWWYSHVMKFSFKMYIRVLTTLLIRFGSAMVVLAFQVIPSRRSELTADWNMVIQTWSEMRAHTRGTTCLLVRFVYLKWMVSMVKSFYLLTVCSLWYPVHICSIRHVYWVVCDFIDGL